MKPSLPGASKLTIDLEKGLGAAEELIDKERPNSIDFYYGKEFIGSIEHEAGLEAIRGYHLRKLLKQKFYNRLADVLYPHHIFTNKK